MKNLIPSNDLDTIFNSYHHHFPSMLQSLEKPQYHNKNTLYTEAFIKNLPNLKLIKNPSFRINRKRLYNLISQGRPYKARLPSRELPLEHTTGNLFHIKIKPIIPLCNTRNFSNVSIKKVKKVPSQNEVLNDINSNDNLIKEILNYSNKKSQSTKAKNNFNRKMILYEHLCNKINNKSLYICAEYILSKLKNHNINIREPKFTKNNIMLKIILEKIDKEVEDNSKYNKVYTVEKIFSLLNGELAKYKKLFCKDKPIHSLTTLNTTKKEKCNTEMNNANNFTSNEISNINSIININTNINIISNINSEISNYYIKSKIHKKPKTKLLNNKKQFLLLPNFYTDNSDIHKRQLNNNIHPIKNKKKIPPFLSLETTKGLHSSNKEIDCEFSLESLQRIKRRKVPFEINYRSSDIIKTETNENENKRYLIKGKNKKTHCENKKNWNIIIPKEYSGVNSDSDFEDFSLVTEKINIETQK